MWNRLFFSFLLVLLANQAGAAERADVCANYRTEDGWSKGYEVEATILDGSELNKATRSFDYKIHTTYVEIFWDKDQASIIEMYFPYMGRGPDILKGEDQQGRKWMITVNMPCF